MRRGGPVVFATGGTGGHIYPALAVAREVVSRGHPAVFLGQSGGMEAALVPQEGFAFHGVAAGKWDRQRPDARSGLEAWRGLWQAVAILQRLKPALVVGFGGFASFPGLAAARFLRVPYILHEGNAYPGRVVRLFAGGARVAAVSHEAARAHLPKAKKLVLTGFPVRETRLGKAEARSRLGLPQEGLLTLVMGGSQGSKVLNETVPEAYRALAQKPLVLHSTGKGWLEQVQARVTDANYHLSGFVDATLGWAAADLAITRAGVSTLAEAAFHGVPAIMVPLPTSAEDHQRHNARAVAEAGAGWLVEESDLGKLAHVWARAIEPEVRGPAGAAALRLSPAGAAKRLADLIDAALSAAPTPGQPQGSL